MNFFAERLKYFRSKKKLTQQELADAIGKSRKLISDYESGRVEPRPLTFFSILEALGIDEATFNSGITSVLPWIDEPNEITFQFDSNLKIVLSNTECLRYGLNASMTEITRIYGDSMSPLIIDGDAILFDRSQTTIADGKVYALNYGGMFIVKRLYNLPFGGLKLHSENCIIYPDVLLESKTKVDEYIEILGRVVYRQGFL